MSDDFYDNLKKSIEMDWAKRLKVLEDVYASNQKTMESIQKMLNSDVFVELQKQIQRFQIQLEAIKEKPKFYKRLKEEGWFIAPVLLDLPSHVTDDLENKSGEDLTTYFCQLLRNDDFSLLSAMIDSWKDTPEYIKRKTIIDAAVEAHKQNQFELSVPALGLLIEGILKDIVGVAKFNAQNHINQHYKQKLSPRLTPYDQLTQEEKIFADLLIKEIFGGNKKWSRNEIAHNYLPEHATEENSTRSLFMLDKIIRDWGNISISESVS
jgi:uncharacterized coiled-coil protein SlyX